MAAPVQAPAAVVRRSDDQAYPMGLHAMLAGVWDRRGLAWQLGRRDVASRYRGSALGMSWAVLNPLVMLSVYTFVFGYLFNSDKAHLSPAAVTDIAFNIFCGLIVFNLLAECMNRAPGLVLSNVNFVKKVVFPLDLLAWAVTGAALFNAAVTLLLMVALDSLAHGALRWTVLFAPLILVPFAFFSLGVTWLLAALGVYLRDIAQTIGNLTMLLMFLSPVFYGASYLPGWLRPYFALNPLTLPIESLRLAVLKGQVPELGYLALYAALSLLAAWLGFAFFQKFRKGFADVI